MRGEENYWTEALRKRLARRQVLKAGAAAGLGLVGYSLVGCGGKQELKPSGSGSTEPKAGGILNTVVNADPTTPDPHKSNPTLALTFVGNVYSRLVETAPDLKIRPDAAESWEQPDPSTYIFRLRDGIKFHNKAPVNGRQCTSTDVKYSLERMAGRVQQDATFSFFRYYENMDTIETPDKLTVKIKMKQPDASFLGVLAFGHGGIIPKEYADQPNSFVKEGMGTGPFIMEEFKAGEYIKMVKNPDYFVKGLPHLDGINVRIIVEDSTILAAFRSKQLDAAGMMIQGLFDYKTAQELKKDSHIVIKEVLEPTVPVLLMNLDGPPFNDPKVRKAVHLALDRKKQSDKLYFGQGVPQAPIMPNWAEWAIPTDELNKMPGYRQPKDQDLAEAKRLMAEAGYPNGFETSILNMPTWRQWVELGESVQDLLKPIGINAKIDMVERGAWGGELREKRNWGLAVLIFGIYPDPGEWLYSMTLSTDTRNLSHYKNPEIDKLQLQQKAETNVDKRKQLLKDIQLKLLEEGPPFVLCVSRPDNWCYWDYVKDYTPGSNWNFHEYRNAWLDK